MTKDQAKQGGKFYYDYFKNIMMLYVYMHMHRKQGQGRTLQFNNIDFSLFRLQKTVI